MKAKLLTRAGKDCRTIVPLTDAIFASWRDGLEPAHQRWVRAQGFEAKAGQE